MNQSFSAPQELNPFVLSGLLMPSLKYIDVVELQLLRQITTSYRIASADRRRIGCHGGFPVCHFESFAFRVSLVVYMREVSIKSIPFSREYTTISIASRSLSR